MEHSSHGLSERVVVRVERRRVVGAAAWFEVLGGSEQWFNGLASENNQGGYRLEACRPGLIATCVAPMRCTICWPRNFLGRKLPAWDHIVRVSAGRAHGRVPLDRKR